MKFTLVPLLGILSLLLPARVDAHDVSGVWETDRGVLVLNQKGASVSGSYSTAAGRVAGQLKENVLEGFWTDEGGTADCGEMREGRKSWGRFRLVFEANTFIGNWGLCGAEPSASSWEGRRQGQVKADIDLSGAWKTSEATLTLVQDGNVVTGTYDKNGGQLRGALAGKVLEAYWVQTSSAQECDRPRNGSVHWGRLRLVFDRSSFSGYFGYCDGPLKLPWNGKR